MALSETELYLLSSIALNYTQIWSRRNRLLTLMLLTEAISHPGSHRARGGTTTTTLARTRTLRADPSGVVAAVAEVAAKVEAISAVCPSRDAPSGGDVAAVAASRTDRLTVRITTRKEPTMHTSAPTVIRRVETGEVAAAAVPSPSGAAQEVAVDSEAVVAAATGRKPALCARTTSPATRRL